jgi:hypothetical protein
MTPFEDAGAYSQDDAGSDSDSEAGHATATYSEREESSDNESGAEDAVEDLSGLAPGSCKHVGVRISTCNLVYSNPMPVSPHTGRHLTCGSPSSWPLLSGELAASTDDKENGHHALVRASTVLRRKAASSGTPNVVVQPSTW